MFECFPPFLVSLLIVRGHTRIACLLDGLLPPPICAGFSFSIRANDDRWTSFLTLIRPLTNGELANFLNFFLLSSFFSPPLFSSPVLCTA